MEEIAMSDCTSELGTVCEDPACPVHKVIPREVIQEAVFKKLVKSDKCAEECKFNFPASGPCRRYCLQLRDEILLARRKK